MMLVKLPEGSSGRVDFGNEVTIANGMKQSQLATGVPYVV